MHVISFSRAIRKTSAFDLPRVRTYYILALTDHRALEFLDSTAQHNSRIARWKIILDNYDIRTEYRRGIDHANCDGLSRIEFD